MTDGFASTTPACRQRRAFDLTTHCATQKDARWNRLRTDDARRSAPAFEILLVGAPE